MNGVPDYHGLSYHPGQSGASYDQYAQDRGLTAAEHGSTHANMMGGAQTLDQIISHNNQELLRRRSGYMPQYRPNPFPDTHQRRASMMEFGSITNNDLAEFQFDPSPAHSVLSGHVASNVPLQKLLDPRKARSRESLSLDTRFSQMDNNFSSAASAKSYPTMMSAPPMSVDSSSAYLPQEMDLSVDYENVTGDITPIHNMPTTSMSPPVFSESALAQNFPISYPTSNADLEANDSIAHPPIQQAARSQARAGPPKSFITQHPRFRQNMAYHNPLPASHIQEMDAIPSPALMHQIKQRRMSTSDVAPAYGQADEVFADPAHRSLANQQSNKFSNAYAPSGFDMLGVLMRVATRKNPEINIGPVDLSCAFVVCDFKQHDLPIVYCSDAFERLTGYTKYEILGRNCRFLQAPDGKVQSGVKRKYVDDRSILYLKNQINKRAEAQLSLINYRKGGQPFMNLLTMIPVPWDTDEFRFFVGFQVDLVEQPNSVSGKNPDGTYAINYQRGQLAPYVIQPPERTNSLQADFGQTISRDEVSAVLATIGTSDSENVKRIWDKVLLENTDDVVHVLSLKGLFLYLSPACRKVLEYDPSDLVGTALSSVCHPSDIVPVTRELKESSSGAAVNVVYRIRRKNSGYTWFESHGCLHTEQGKGRKCIILVGRERPVYALNRNDISTDGGISDSELWSKMSTSGMFLYISSNVRPMLDRPPEELVGTSMQALMRPESKKELGKALEVARVGEKSSFKHDLQNRRGQVLQAQTTIYPGDAHKGFKPTFIIAQTRLLKMTRAMLLNQKSTASPKADQRSMGSTTPPTQISGQSSSQAPSRQTSTAMSPPSVLGQNVITTSGGNGLILGNQDEALASEDNIFDELKTTRSSSWQFELRQMERQNRLLQEELQGLLARKKKRKRRKGMGQLEKDCANCHTRVTPEWRRGPSGQRDLCNSCGLRWAKQVSIMASPTSL